jgi:hypothetical protein
MVRAMRSRRRHYARKSVFPKKPFLGLDRGADPVFGKDDAQTNGRSGMTLRRKVVLPWRKSRYTID